MLYWLIWSAGTNTSGGDHTSTHIGGIFRRFGYATIGQVDDWEPMRGGHSVVSHSLHAIDWRCGPGQPFGLMPCGVDLERKKVAGIFTSE